MTESTYLPLYSFGWYSIGDRFLRSGVSWCRGRLLGLDIHVFAYPSRSPALHFSRNLGRIILISHYSLVWGLVKCFSLIVSACIYLINEYHNLCFDYNYISWWLITISPIFYLGWWYWLIIGLSSSTWSMSYLGYIVELYVCTEILIARHIL